MCRLLCWVLLAWAPLQAEISPFPVADAAQTYATGQRDAWADPARHAKLLSLFPGDGELLRVYRQQQSNEALLRGSLIDLWSHALRETEGLDYSARLRALESVARTTKDPAVLQALVTSSIVLPPEIESALEKYQADKLHQRSLLAALEQSVQTQWDRVPRTGIRGTQLKVMQVDQRRMYAPNETADIVTSYVTQWYLEDNSDAAVLGLRPTKSGWSGPSLPRPTRNFALVAPSTGPALFHESPSRARVALPVSEVITHCDSFPSQAKLRGVTNSDSGWLILVSSPMNTRTALQSQLEAGYRNLRPLMFQQPAWASVTFPAWALLSTQLAKGKFYAKIVALAADTTMTATAPEFFFLQTLFPGSLRTQADLDQLKADPYRFVATHLSNMLLDQQPSTAPWPVSFNISLLYYYWE